MNNKEAADSVKGKVGDGDYARFLEILVNESPDKAEKFLNKMGIGKEESALAVQYEEEMFLSA
jgi:hypothetical protein